MKCPNCQSEDTHRSRRRGPKEGITLRLKHQAPYRCRQCGSRFVAAENEGSADAVRRHLSFADYLGLRGPTRKLLSDHVILGTLIFLLLAIMIALLFALALGWIDPLSLLSESTWKPTAGELERIARQ